MPTFAADGLRATGVVEPHHDLGAGVLAVGARRRVEPEVVGRVPLTRGRVGHGDARADRPEGAAGGLHGGEARRAVGVVAAPVDRRVALGGAAGRHAAVGLRDRETRRRRLDALLRGRAPAVVLDAVLPVRGSRLGVLVAQGRRGRRARGADGGHRRGGARHEGGHGRGHSELGSDRGGEGTQARHAAVSSARAPDLSVLRCGVHHSSCLLTCGGPGRPPPRHPRPRHRRGPSSGRRAATSGTRGRATRG